MSKNLYCPKCKTEYWGEIKSVKQSWNDYKNDCFCACGYIFTFKDFEKAIGYGSVSRGISDDKNFVGDLITIIKKHNRNTYLDARFHIRKDFETLLKKHEL